MYHQYLLDLHLPDDDKMNLEGWIEAGYDDGYHDWDPTRKTWVLNEAGRQHLEEAQKHFETGAHDTNYPSWVTTSYDKAKYDQWKAEGGEEKEKERQAAMVFNEDTQRWEDSREIRDVSGDIDQYENENQHYVDMEPNTEQITDRGAEGEDEQNDE